MAKKLKDKDDDDNPLLVKFIVDTLAIIL